MAHEATNRFSYAGQFGILALFCGVGMIVGGVVGLIPLLGKFSFSDLQGASSAQIMDRIMKPENATAIRWMQFITTLFLFFIPALLYAFICHRNSLRHLGYHKSFDLRQVAVVGLVMIASLTVVGSLQELTTMLPWPKSMLITFKEAEESYNKQVMVIGRMNNFGDYLVSMVLIALLPALFEETLFRGALQNLLSRWFRHPVAAIIVTAILFSAIHGSYLGFLSRFALGFILGWIYYRTGNLWLSIIGHFINNGIALTALYLTSKPGQAIDPSRIDDRFPLWIGAIGLAAVVGLLFAFDKASADQIDRPGAEALIAGHSDNPFNQ